MNTKVFQCFSRVYNSYLRTINLTKVMNLHRSNYILNISRSMSSQGTQPQGSQSTQPQGSQSTQPQGSQSTQPQGSEGTQPQGSQGTQTPDAVVTEKFVQKVNFTFIRANGERVDVSGDVGETVMAVAGENDLDVEGACSGALACTTCHVYIDEKTESIVQEASTKEDDLLDTAPFLKPNSRLSCQIRLTKELEGVTFTLPKGTVNMHVDNS